MLFVVNTTRIYMMYNGHGGSANVGQGIREKSRSYHASVDAQKEVKTPIFRCILWKPRCLSWPWVLGSNASGIFRQGHSKADWVFNFSINMCLYGSVAVPIASPFFIILASVTGNKKFEIGSLIVFSVFFAFGLTALSILLFERCTASVSNTLGKRSAGAEADTCEGQTKAAEEVSSLTGRGSVHHEESMPAPQVDTVSNQTLVNGNALYPNLTHC